MPVHSRPLALAFAAALVLAMPVAAAAQTTVASVSSHVDSDGNLVFRPLALEELMTPDEQKATGIGKLSPEERVALAAWAARRSAAAVAEALDGRPAGGGHVVPRETRPALVAARDERPVAAPTSAPVSVTAHIASPAIAGAEVPLPSGAGDSETVPAARPRRVIPWAFQLGEVRAGGWFVQLGNGSLWEIAPEDRPTAAAWESGQPIVLHPIGAPTGDFGTALINAETHQTAAARFAGQTWER